MHNQKNIRAIIFILCISSTVIYSQILTGRITNQKKVPLPYANIYCMELNKGTTSNLEGDFIFKLKPGQFKIIISYVGYISDTLLIKIISDEKKEINIDLKEHTTELKTIFVFDTQLSEAERIIANTIANKTDYLQRINNYEYSAYDKTVLTMKWKDSVIIGGIMESQTKAYFMQPDKFNEVVLAKKQTKNMMSAYTNFFTMGKVSNILEEEIRIDESSIISPLNSNAFDYYSYQMKDTTFYNNRRLFVIAFEPKNTIIPLFSGELVIIDEIYLPVVFKLNGGNSVLTAARKEIIIEEKYAEFENGLWLPVFIDEKYRFNISIPGFPPMYGYHTCLLSDYKINNPNFDLEFTKNIQTENLIPETEAKNLWENNQQIVLTNEEKKAVAKIDSVMESFSFIKKSLFWIMQNSFGGMNDLPITTFNDFYHFNRIEGHYAGIGIKLNKLIDNTVFEFKSGYGFADKKLKYGFNISNTYKKLNLYLDLFNHLKKQNKFFNYGDFDITFQSWFDKNDYADYYYSKGLKTGFGLQLHENILVNLEFEKRKDENAYLTSNWSLLNKSGSYRLNPAIDEGNISEYKLKISYDDKNYYDLGFLRIPDNSQSYFDCELQITRGTFNSSSEQSYWQTHIMLNVYHQSSTWFNPSFTIRGGINTDFKLKQNQFHLPGNYGTLSSPKFFTTLRNDDYIGNRYGMLILENNFNNVINKILGVPFLKNNRFDFLIFGKYGWIDEDPQFHPSKHLYETGFGIGNIFTFLRLDFTWRLQPDSKSMFYVNLLSMYEF